jgi:hypothetical protein
VVRTAFGLLFILTILLNGICWIMLACSRHLWHRRVP